MSSSFALSAARVVGSVALPVLLGVGTVFLLVPLDPPDEEWGHTATHAIPAAVLLGVLLLGRRWWPPVADRAGAVTRRVLSVALATTAAAQAGEATAAALGVHDGVGHTLFMALGVLTLPVVLVSGAAAVLVAVVRLPFVRRAVGHSA